MSKKFRVFDPLTGEHQDVNTASQAQQVLEATVARVLDAFMPSVVEVDTDSEGNETWIKFELSDSVRVAPGLIPLTKRAPVANVTPPRKPGPP